MSKKLMTAFFIPMKERIYLEELIFTILFEYQHTAASFLSKIYGVSKATVYNLVNSFEIPKLDIERFEKDDDSPVYMEIDEDHMRCRKSRNTYMRMVGIEKVCKDRNKAHKLYFNGTRVDSMEKNYLPNIISEVGKGTNIPYLRGGENLMRKAMKEKYHKAE